MSANGCSCLVYQRSFLVAGNLVEDGEGPRGKIYQEVEITWSVQPGEKETETDVIVV